MARIQPAETDGQYQDIEGAEPSTLPPPTNVLGREIPVPRPQLGVVASNTQTILAPGCSGAIPCLTCLCDLINDYAP